MTCDNIEPPAMRFGVVGECDVSSSASLREEGRSIPRNSGMENDRDSREPGNAFPVHFTLRPLHFTTLGKFSSLKWTIVCWLGCLLWAICVHAYASWQQAL